MKAWLLDGFTGVQSLRLAEVPDPVPGPGEVLLRVRYAGLNPADAYLAVNQYPGKPVFPHILGRDAVGQVVAAGPGAEHLQGSQPQMILRGEMGLGRPGTFAQLIAVPADLLVPKPADWTDEQSGGATLVYLTAYQALTMWGPLRAGAPVLITGASGGVGLAAVQLARAMGLKPLALSRSGEKGARLLGFGAAGVFNPEEEGWDKKLKAFLAPGRVDLVVDNVGGKLLPTAIALLGDQGKVSVVGRLAGPVPEFNTATLFFRRIRLGGVAVGAYSAAEARAAWSEVSSFMRASGARPVVDSVFAFDQVREAFKRLAEGPLGKVLVRVS